MLPSPARELPEGPQWSYEGKYDGWRAVAYLQENEVRLLSRTGNDFTEKCPSIVKETPLAFPDVNLVLDGEIVVTDEQGLQARSRLQQRHQNPIFVVFDLLEVNGDPIVDFSLAERRENLEVFMNDSYFPSRLSIDESGRSSRHLQISEVFHERDVVFEAVKHLDMEGVVAKDVRSKYRGGRSRSWLKSVRHDYRHR